MDDFQNEQFKEVLKDANLAQFPDMDKVNQELKSRARQSIQHSWHQEGPSLVCESCPHRHSQWIGQGKRLVGFNSRGEPETENVI